MDHYHNDAMPLFSCTFGPGRAPAGDERPDADAAGSEPTEGAPTRGPSTDAVDAGDGLGELAIIANEAGLAPSPGGVTGTGPAFAPNQESARRIAALHAAADGIHRGLFEVLEPLLEVDEHADYTHYEDLEQGNTCKTGAAYCRVAFGWQERTTRGYVRIAKLVRAWDIPRDLVVAAGPTKLDAIAAVDQQRLDRETVLALVAMAGKVTAKDLRKELEKRLGGPKKKGQTRAKAPMTSRRGSTAAFTVSGDEAQQATIHEALARAGDVVGKTDPADALVEIAARYIDTHGPAAAKRPAEILDALARAHGKLLVVADEDALGLRVVAGHDVLARIHQAGLCGCAAAEDGETETE